MRTTTTYSTGTAPVRGRQIDRENRSCEPAVVHLLRGASW